MNDIYELSLDPKYVEESRYWYTLVEDTARDFKMSEEEIDELMQGTVDIHCHANPEITVRRPESYNDIDISIRAVQDGMRALVFKCHTSSSADRMYYVRRAVIAWCKEHNIEKKFDPFGGIVLNYTVGALNPEAVKACAKYGGKFVWLPNHDSVHHRRVMGGKGGIEVLDEKDEALPELKDIFGIIADNHMTLNLCHLSTKERYVLIDEAKKEGVKNIIVAHPQECLTRATMDQMEEMARKGAYIELTYSSAVPNFYSGNTDPKEVAKIIHRVGPQHCVAGSDSSSLALPHPVHAMRLFVEGLLLLGVSREDIEIVFKKNAAEILGLDTE